MVSSLFARSTTGLLAGINANTYLKMMSHTAAVNIGVFFGLTGRIVTTSSACTSDLTSELESAETMMNGMAARMRS